MEEHRRETTATSSDHKSVCVSLLSSSYSPHTVSNGVGVDGDTNTRNHTPVDVKRMLTSQPLSHEELQERHSNVEPYKKNPAVKIQPIITTNIKQ